MSDMKMIQPSRDGALTVEYDDKTPLLFAWASIIWGIVGMLVGVIVALQLVVWQANVHPWLSFGRLRPLHTNAVIFAFVGNMIFSGIYYSIQRLLKTRMASNALSGIHFWGWQCIILAAAITLPLGLSQGKEYAELEWPIDLTIAAVWVVFAINFFWTIAKRNEKHIYVAIWFYISTVITVAILHIINSLSLPVFAGTLKSYSIFGGAQDALVQWWYGHNAVAFFLTTPVLGIMYYFLPKAADRPVYSYRLSIIHFWALIFIYIWAGPHHLLYTALPEWTQSLGMIFSLMLWAPSWGGMLNGLLTLRGAWGKVQADPVLKFFAAGVIFYGMSTFEGPLLSIKSVNSLAHYTDWIIGHVHGGALGWNGLMAAGMFYWLLPKIYNRKLHSTGLANLHFYMATIGILTYMISMWVSGITQGLMWRATDAEGLLQYPSFVETLIAIRPMYWARFLGGTLYLSGMLVMVYNLVRTAQGATVSSVKVEVIPLPKENLVPFSSLLISKPILVSIAVLVFVCLGAVTNLIVSPLFMIVALIVGLFGGLAIQSAKKDGEPAWHRILEGRSLMFSSLAAIAVIAGGVAELIPSLLVRPAEIAAGHDIHPYTPLELEGRDIYLREGCYTCHSQMIRPMVFESQRYGKVSKMEDSVYDHPFQWGSKRTGPDLAREGNKYSNLWHYKHFFDPRSVTVGSNMPPYSQFASSHLDPSRVEAKVSAMKTLGVPYTKEDVQLSQAHLQKQAADIAKDLKENGIDVAQNSEMVAIIAYIQRLGLSKSKATSLWSSDSPATAKNVNDSSNHQTAESKGGL